MKHSSWPIVIGSSGTLIWIVIFAIYILGRCQSILDLQPNELGDFLAGVFAPPVFFWLIVGYFLQARELRLQAKELSHQVEATRQIAMASLSGDRRQSRMMQPRFLIKATGTQKLTIVNAVDGNNATEVSFGLIDGELRLEELDAPIFSKGSSSDVMMEQCSAGRIQLLYTDTHAERHSVWFEFDGQPDSYATQMGPPEPI